MDRDSLSSSAELSNPYLSQLMDLCSAELTSGRTRGLFSVGKQSLLLALTESNRTPDETIHRQTLASYPSHVIGLQFRRLLRL